MRQQHTIATDHHIFVDHDIRTDSGILADLGRVMDHRRGVNSNRVTRRAVEELERACEAQIRIARTQSCSRKSREVLGNDYGCSFGGFRGGGVFGIGQEGQLSGSCFFDSRDARNLSVGGAVL